jgi:cytosine/adenosine deaminase-related metal-dependent hydrolase
MPRKVIRGGHVLSMDPAVGDHAGGDVLIQDGVITEVGSTIDAGDAEIVDATGLVVMPGLIDTHRHTWQGAFAQAAADWTLNEYLGGIIGRLSPVFTPQDVRDGTHFGADPSWYFGSEHRHPDDVRRIAATYFNSTDPAAHPGPRCARPGDVDHRRPRRPPPGRGLPRPPPGLTGR